jgi:preprotein translocase subunit SecY
MPVHLGLDHHSADDHGLAHASSSSRRRVSKGRKVMNQYTRYPDRAAGAVPVLRASRSGSAGRRQCGDRPGWFFRISTVITLTGGTMFLMWLGEQITARGIGNGISLHHHVGHRGGAAGALAQAFELGRQGALSTGLLLAVLVMAVVVIAFIVFMERAQRRLLIQYPKRQVGNRMFEGQSSHLPLKLNTSGVIPPIFASSLLLLPTTVANFNAGSGPEWFQAIVTQLGHGRPLFLVLYIALIIFFAFFYTAIVFNPTETRRTSRSMAASFRASGRASGRPSTSTTCSRASPLSARSIWRWCACCRRSSSPTRPACSISAARRC